LDPNSHWSDGDQLRILLLASLFSLLASAAQAQGLLHASGGLAGYSGFFGRSAVSVHAGAGGEVVAADRVGIGGEFGIFNRLMVGSANATVHLNGVKTATFSPFLTGGYSRFGIGDGEGAFNTFNVGAGLHYWAAKRVGFRVEVRDHFRPDDRGTTQYWSLRAGIAFR
jgi:hypothetical protein